eukprot:scaffold5400_cov116-Isochrysis_galbana.AAC.4
MDGIKTTRTTTAYAASVSSAGFVSQTTSPARNVEKPCRLGGGAALQLRPERRAARGRSTRLGTIWTGGRG